MKKVLSVLLAVVMVFALCSVAFAGVELQGNNAAKLSFNADGSFKIMQINDFQDGKNVSDKTVKFVKAALRAENPDLAIVPGDNLTEWFGIFGISNKNTIKAAIRNITKIFDEVKIPFAVTFGNHDHDVDSVLSPVEQMEVYKESAYCVWAEGCDAGTFNLPIMSSDGSKIVSNIYILDSNNKGSVTSVSGYSGLYPEQVQWYKDTSNALKAENGGEAVPSILFQHVPVKEIYGTLTQVTKKEANVATFSTNDYNWYVLNKAYVISPAEETVFGEAPCSEALDSSTGEYEAWLEQGDIIGAFFGHDHLNNFVVKDDNGIVMGYTGGSGFGAYGDGDKRVIRVFELNENDVENYTTRCVYYKDLCGSLSFVLSDIMSTAIFGDILRSIYRIFGITSW